MQPPKTTKKSEPGKVNEFMERLEHPLADVLAALRRIILETDPEIGEEIKWNAPAFFFTGEMQRSDPKEYQRYLIVSNFFKKDCIRLVFWKSDHVKDQAGFLQGNYPDGRRLALFNRMEDVTTNRSNLQSTLRQQLDRLRSL